MKIHGIFKFHNVGQGLFYSGLLINTNAPGNPEFFSFVYDCGAVPSKDLNSKIDSFKNSLPSPGSSGEKTLNLLVISHLHDDHVNGLEHLLKDIKVDTVVMPYLDEGLKSLPLLESTEEDEFLSDLYRDPVEWFASKGVRRIFLLVAEDTTFEKKDGSPNQTTIFGDSGIIVEDPERVSFTEKRQNTIIAHLKSNSTVKCSNFCWEFNFENLKLDPVWVDTYTNIIEEHINKHGSLENILNNNHLTKVLMAEINKISSAKMLNRTSVILLHCPAEKVADVWFGCCKGYLCKYCMTECGEHSFCNNVLTGDVELENGEHFEILDEVLEKHECYVLQFPHHGAKNDRNIDYFSAFQANATVLSYGIGNRYKHPRTEVVYRLDRPVLVNEKQSFEYQIFVRK